MPKTHLNGNDTKKCKVKSDHTTYKRSKYSKGRDGHAGGESKANSMPPAKTPSERQRYKEVQSQKMF